MSVFHRLDGPAGAPVLVLAHSLGTTHAMWQPQVAALAADHRVVRYDHRGHGRSPVPPGPYRVEELGADLLGLLDSLGVDRAGVAGLSLGGMVGMWLAAHAPSRVGRLALLCTSACPGDRPMWTERAATVRSRGVAAVADGALERWFSPEFRHRHPGVLAWARTMLVGTPAEGYAAACEAIGALDLTPVLPRIATPTLVVAGAGDPALPVPHSERIAAAIPGARLSIVDAAHLANVEQPDLVTGLLTQFFSGGAA